MNMIEEVVSAHLPVGETLKIQKNRIEGAEPQKRRLAIVTGTHGDELEGQYIAWQLARVLKKRQPLLRGTVDIYPALNPLGISTIYRGLPGFDLDMNRIATDSILRFLTRHGFLKDVPLPEGEATQAVSEKNLVTIRNICGGILLHCRPTSSQVQAGEIMANIVDPYTATVLEEIRAPQKGTIFFARHAQIISAQTIVFRLIPG